MTCLFVETITSSFISKHQHSRGRQTYIFGSYQCQIELNHKDTQESGSFAALIYDKNSMGNFQKHSNISCVENLIVTVYNACHTNIFF